MDTSARDKAMADRFKARMEGDYDPGLKPERPITPDDRAANALDYIAYQMGQINRNLARLVDHLEKQAK